MCNDPGPFDGMIYIVSNIRIQKNSNYKSHIFLKGYNTHYSVLYIYEYKPVTPICCPSTNFMHYPHIFVIVDLR